MQIVNEKRSASVQGMQAQRQFTVKVGAHIMTVLSGLYKNPVDAMVREYTTNMYDAWLALKRENPRAIYTPCEIHLPTALSPFLVFKDYGIGMSFDTVWEVYSQYGNSTKSDNNDEVGGFGLGSKTAFCYNNGQQWTIESRYNGELMTFMAFVGEDGIPNITHVTTVPTTEHNGVTIRVPIRREHMAAAISAAQTYVPYFPMDIQVFNADKPITKPDYTIRGDAWGIGPMPEGTSSWNNPGRLRVVMGNVPYTVDTKELPGLARLSRLARNAIDLYVPIGSVDIVPSRDSLKYTDRTKATIDAQIDVLIQELKQKVGLVVDTEPSEWAALQKFMNLHIVDGLRDVVTTVTWRGKTIDTVHGIVRTTADIQKLDRTAEISCYGITSTNRATPEAVAVPCLMPGQKHYLMIDDLTKGSVQVAKGYVYTKLVNRSSNTGRALKYGHTIGHVVLVKTKLTKQQLSDFFGGFPEDQILTASSVSGKIKMPAGMKGNDALYRFDGGKTWGARVNVPQGTVFYYLELSQDAHSKRWVPASFDADDVRNLLHMAKELKVDVPQLYGIKKGEVGQFDASVWKPLLPALKAAAQRVVDRDTVMSVRFQREVTTEMQMMMKLLTAAGNNADFQDFIAEYKAIEAAKSNVDLVVAAKSRSHRLDLDVKWPSVKNTTVPMLQTLYDKITQKYPMFTVLIGLGKNVYSYHYNHNNPFTPHSNIINDYVNG